MSIAGQSYYPDQTFKQIKLDAGEVQGSEFVGCIFVGVIFSRAVFRSCRFIHCEFRSCDLSLVQLPDTSISGATFLDSKLIGVDWTLLNWEREVLGEPLIFKDSVLNHSTFIGLDFKDVQFLACTLKNVDFRETNLSNADFSGSDLQEGMFIKTNLTRANLESARNYAISPERNTLTNARFSFPEALSLLYAMNIHLEGASQTEGSF